MRSKTIKAIALTLAAMMAVSVAVMAAPSVTANGGVAQDSVTVGGEALDTSKYETKFSAEAVAEDVKALIDAPVNEAIEAVNADSAKVADIVKEAAVATGDTVDTSKLQMLTQIQDLSIREVGTGKLVEDAKNVTVTWEVPNLTEGMGEVRVLHYSVQRKVWELLQPDKVDFANKAITQTFEDLSPVAVVYVPAEGTTTTATTTDNVKTGDTMNTVLYVVIAAAAVIMIGALVLGKKKARN